MSNIELLVIKAQKGDSQAYQELFCAYEEDIYRMAYLYLQNEEDALDAVQETAYRSFKSIAKLKEARYFKTWLIRIAISCSIDLLRQRKKGIQHKLEQVVRIELNEDISLSVTLQDLMTVLDEDEKGVILLRFYHDYTIKEAAEILRIPLGTGKTILYRALSKLRSIVKEEDMYEQ